MSAALTDILLAQRPSCGDQPLSRFMTLSHGSRVYAVASKTDKSEATGKHYAWHATREDNVIRLLERVKTRKP